MKLGAFCYAAIAKRHNPKEQDHWSEPLWLVHWEGWAGHPLYLLPSEIQCTGSLCLHRDHPKLPKPLSHQTCGPQWVIFVPAEWASFWRQGQHYGGGGISLCAFYPLSPTVGQVIGWASKQGGWHGVLRLQAVGEMKRLQAPSHKTSPVFLRRIVTDSCRTPRRKVAWLKAEGHRPSQLVGPKQLSVQPQPKPDSPWVLTESINWIFISLLWQCCWTDCYKLFKSFKESPYSKLVNMVNSANWLLSTLIFDDGFMELTQRLGLPLPVTPTGLAQHLHINQCSGKTLDLGVAVSGLCAHSWLSAQGHPSGSPQLFSLCKDTLLC